MTLTPALLLQSHDAVGGLIGAVFAGGFFLVMCLLMVVVIVGWWKMFVKAGQPGWAAIIPIYNIYVLLKIAGRPGWWLLLFCIPFVNFIILIIVAIDVAKAFGQGVAFALILLVLLGGIGYIVLGFGNYQYQKPATA